jgi:malonyl-CoA/methylmalonyl-CoA synthetase
VPGAAKNHLAACLSAGTRSSPFATLADGRTVTRDALWGRAARVAGALAALGVRPGDRVAAQTEKCFAALELYLGTVLAGAVYLPLNPAYTAAEVAHVLSDAEPRVFIADPPRAGGLAAAARAAGVGTLLTLGADGAGSLTDAADAAAALPAVPRGPDDLAAILYTSGTTGRSKGAMLTHANLASNAGTLAAAWAFTDRDVLIHALPIFHTHGLFVATNVILLSGGRMLWHPRFEAAAVLADFAHATALMGVPTFYTRLLGEPGLTEGACRGMRLFISGSAPLLAETHRQWQARTGHAILERYGMTETGMNSSNPLAGERRAGTVGLPLPGVEIRVADADGRQLPAGETGGIEVRGPNVFKGYWRMPEKTAEDMRPDGFFITGDVGRFDADGYLTIVGRSKDVIISGGFNIYPREVEAVIDRVPGVAESAVFGLPHPDLGEGVAAAVVPAAGSAPSRAAIEAACAANLARFKHPRHVVFLDELPRNAMGKVLKAVLRDAHRAAFGGGGA